MSEISEAGPDTKSKLLARLLLEGNKSSHTGYDNRELLARALMEPVLKAFNPSAALSPFVNYPGTYNEMRREAQDQMWRGLEQIKTTVTQATGPGAEKGRGEKVGNIGWGAANLGLGALNYVGSPINAALRAVAGKPIQDVTGIPKEYTEFAIGMASPLLGARGIKVPSYTTPPPPFFSSTLPELATRQST